MFMYRLSNGVFSTCFVYVSRFIFAQSSVVPLFVINGHPYSCQSLTRVPHFKIKRQDYVQSFQILVPLHILLSFVRLFSPKYIAIAIISSHLNGGRMMSSSYILLSPSRSTSLSFELSMLILDECFMEGQKILFLLKIPVQNKIKFKKKIKKVRNKKERKIERRNAKSAGEQKMYIILFPLVLTKITF